jgi:hypothetical protein
MITKTKVFLSIGIINVCVEDGIPLPKAEGQSHNYLNIENTECFKKMPLYDIRLVPSVWKELQDFFSDMINFK